MGVGGTWVEREKGDKDDHPGDPLGLSYSPAHQPCCLRVASGGAETGVLERSERCVSSMFTSNSQAPNPGEELAQWNRAGTRVRAEILSQAYQCDSEQGA